jgi:hypothetical protein
MTKANSRKPAPAAHTTRLSPIHRSLFPGIGIFGLGVPITNLPAGIKVKSMVIGWPFAFSPTTILFITGTPRASAVSL